MPRKAKTKYKLKTHKTTAKRFKLTGSGLLVRTRGPKGHFRRNRSRRAKYELGEMHEVSGSRIKRRIKQLVPYISRYNTKATRPGSRGKGKR